MRIVYAAEYSGTRAELLAAIAAHKHAVQVHRYTVGQPAPLAPSLLVEELAETNDPFKLESEFDYAWRSNGVGEPVSVVRVAPGELPPEGWVLTTDDPTGLIVDAEGNLRAETAAELLAKAKRQRELYINGRRDQFIAGGVDFNGWRFDTTPQSIVNLTAAVAFIQAAPLANLTPPATVSWRDESNVDRDLTPVMLIQLGSAVFGRVQGAHGVARAIKDAIAAAETIEAVEAADWPAA